MKKLLLLALILVVFACNSDDNLTLTSADTPSPPDVTTNGVHLLKKTFRDGELSDEHIYTTDSTLVRINRYADNMIATYTDYIYSSDTIVRNSVMESGLWINSTVTYELEDGLIGEDRHSDTGMLGHSRSYFGPDECSMTKRESFKPDCTTLVSFTEPSYTDNNCSSLSTGYNSDMQIRYTEEIIRDDASVYFHSPLTDMLRSNNLGSIIEYNYWDEAGVLNELRSYTAVVEYNDAGYPTKNTRTYAEGTTIVYTYEY